MEEILNNLVVGEILYVTANGTQYLFIRRSNDFGVIYSINHVQKTLPLNTINAAFEAFNNHVIINAQWYTNYNQHEYETRRCNLSVLRNLLARI